MAEILPGRSWLGTLVAAVLLMNISVKGYIYPNSTRSMQDLNIFLNFLAEGVPFGFSHFNDGEIWMIKGNCDIDAATGQAITDYGWQNCSQGLANAMKNAIAHTAPNYYIGIPCACEWHGTRTGFALELLGVATAKEIDYNCAFGKDDTPIKQLRPLSGEGHTINPYVHDRLSVATAFINGNHRRAADTMISLLKQIGQDGDRVVHVVVGQGAMVDKLPFKHNAIFAAATHAFEHNYTTIRTTEFVQQHFKAGDVVLIMLGPLGRILASEWTLLSSEITFIDLGSFFDHEIRNRKYELDNHQRCNFNTDYAADVVPITFRPLHPK